MSSCVVVLGGDKPDPRIRRHLPLRATVIAADSGVDHALYLGLTIDLAVGDFDSVSLAGLAHLQQEQIPTKRYPADKDASDGELALRAALDAGATHITVVTGGGGDRLDHLLITALMLASPQLAGAVVTAWVGLAHIAVVRAAMPWCWPATVGEIVTLLAVDGVAAGVHTEGLQWPLADDTLGPGSRGLSNVATGETCSVSVRSGCVFVVRPQAIT